MVPTFLKLFVKDWGQLFAGKKEMKEENKHDKFFSEKNFSEASLKY